jgi:hypothetical protein
VKDSVALERGIYMHICMTQLPVGGSWGLPTGDCFAGSVDKCHQVRRYFTRYPAAEGMGGGCSGHAVESARPHRGYTAVVVLPTERMP